MSYALPDAPALPQGTIDFHTHVDEAPAFGWIDPPEKLIPLLDEGAVERAVVMTYRDATSDDTSPLEYVARAVARYPERLIGFARIAPSHDDSASELLRLAISEFGFAGLKLHPVGTFQPPSAPATVRLTRVAAELGVPVLFHCGDEGLTTPTAIEGLARQVPEACIVLGHMGGYFHAEEAIAVAARNPGIYLETSATPYPDRIREAVEQLGADRVLFGSDGPGAPPRLEVRKVLMSGLSAEAQAMVLRDNAIRILGGAA
jgi:predicted TIM-barrel fold metal-dependent hydrolase